MPLQSCHRSSGAVWWMRSEGAGLSCVKVSSRALNGKIIPLTPEDALLNLRFQTTEAPAGRLPAELGGSSRIESRFIGANDAVNIDVQFFRSHPMHWIDVGQHRTRK